MEYLGSRIRGLDSTANLAHFHQNWAELAEVFSRQMLNDCQDFFFPLIFSFSIVFLYMKPLRPMPEHKMKISNILPIIQALISRKAASARPWPCLVWLGLNWHDLAQFVARGRWLITRDSWLETQLVGLESKLNEFLFLLEFIYSEKATKFCKIFTLLLTGTT